MKTPILFTYFLFKVHRLFSEGYLKVRKWSPDHHPAHYRKLHFFFLFFCLKCVKPLWKVCTFHHLSNWLFSEGYLKVRKWFFRPPLCALVKTPIFYILFFCLKYVKLLWKVCTFQHLSHRLFSEGYLKVRKLWHYHHPCIRENTIFLNCYFLFKVCQTPLKSMHLSSFDPSVIFGKIPKCQKMVPRPPPCTLEKTTFF